jgi:hypothetical protein
MIQMNIKLIFAITSALLGIISFFPYAKDIFRGKTQPHAFTWLIWSITQGTAVAALWYGGGGIGALGLTVGTLFVFLVFLFSLRFGTKNIRKIDAVILCGALLAVALWWRLHNPLFAVILVTIIDVFGYIPTFRKTFEEPWSETVIAWVGFLVANVFSLLALQEYNLLTMSYVVSISLANLSVVILALSRRKFRKQP